MHVSLREVDVVTALRPEASPAGLSRRRHAMGFWLAGYVFAITIAFSAVPAPLYVLYQARDHFGPPLVTIIFSVYALGVAASLFGVGHVSDWLGRRRILLLAVVTNMASGLLFLLWPTVPGLIIGRIVSGVSIGMLTATATAYLSELHAGARPGAPRTRAEITAAAVSLGGLGPGPLIAGFLTQYAGAPLVVPYLVFEALMLVGCAFLLVTPETVPPPEEKHRSRARSAGPRTGPGNGGHLEPEPAAAAGRRGAGRGRSGRRVQGRHLHGPGNRARGCSGRGAGRPVPGRLPWPGHTGDRARLREPGAQPADRSARVLHPAGGGHRPGSQEAAGAAPGLAPGRCTSAFS
jgi:Major Facilitator Superfamily